MSFKKDAEAVLRDLSMKSGEIQACAVMTRDGSLLASAMRPEVDADRVAAMCAALLGLSETAAKELDRGSLKLVLVHGEQGMLLLVQVGTGYVLALSATTEIKIGSLLMEAKKAAGQLSELRDI